VSSVVIVGGGVAGVATAAALRAGGFDGAVAVVEESELPYDRPPLSKAYLAGDKPLTALALRPPAWYEEQGVELLTGTRATGLWPAESRVELSSGRVLSADRVVLAVGGHAARPGIPGLDSPLVHVLRDRDQADALREALLPGARLLVVGGGLIGAEVASTACGLGVAVTLVDPLAIPLEAVVGPEAGEWLHGLHAQRGVTTRRALLGRLTERGSELVATIGDEAVVFDMALLAVGLSPECSLARSIGLEVAQGVVVDTGQVTSNPAVLSVGDSTRRRLGVGLEPRAEHWEAAQLDGARAAATILGATAPVPTAPWFWSDRHGVHVEAVGHMPAARERAMRGRPGEGPFSVWGVRDGRLVAAVSIDDPNAVRAARRMIDRGVVVSAAALADPGTDLRGLLRG
jgi:NADPH-dependent 2,4-dienoyl-CoA reductase/sulfur reductase-like enzyme